MKTNQNRINSPMGLRICLYVMLLAFGACSSCKKDETPPDPVSTLPPQTQTGANTFACLIDGQPWIPNGSGGFGGAKPVNGGYFGPYINVPKYSIWVRTYKTDRTSINLYVRSVTQTGRYPLNFNTNSDVGGSANSNNFGLYAIDGATINDPDYGYITTSQYTGFVDITRTDTLNQIVSGTFEFEGIDFPSGKKIKITNGRFDLNQKKQ